MIHPGPINYESGSRLFWFDAQLPLRKRLDFAGYFVSVAHVDDVRLGAAARQRDTWREKEQRHPSLKNLACVAVKSQ
jgi:hypothetical protein